MRSCWWLALWCAAILTARAEVQVYIDADRSNHVLYEPVMVRVTVFNNSDQDIVLGADGKPWLSFLVNRMSDGHPVEPDQKFAGDSLELKAGEKKALGINLTPLYAVRSSGDYTVKAVVDIPGMQQTLSAPAAFVIMNGRTIWNQKRPVNASERTYSLVRFAPTPNGTYLYVKVEDENENLVYVNRVLGEIADMQVPQTQFDSEGHLHILHMRAMGTYIYSRIDPDGRLEDQMIYRSTPENPPRLVKVADGSALVIGGQATKPGENRQKLSDSQAGTSGQTLPGPVENNHATH